MKKFLKNIVDGLKQLVFPDDPKLIPLTDEEKQTMAKRATDKFLYGGIMNELMTLPPEKRAYCKGCVLPAENKDLKEKLNNYAEAVYISVHTQKGIVPDCAIEAYKEAVEQRKKGVNFEIKRSHN